jgi:hypothetical protein
MVESPKGAFLAWHLDQMRRGGLKGPLGALQRVIGGGREAARFAGAPRQYRATPTATGTA